MKAMPSSAGYSGTPLAKKLGIREQTTLVAIKAPANYRALLAPIPAGVKMASRPSTATDVVHLFVRARAELVLGLSMLRARVRPDTAIWVSWPKKASKISTDVTEQTIRDEALPLGLVDVKVCAVDETWSGLKLVVRKAMR